MYTKSCFFKALCNCYLLHGEVRVHEFEYARLWEIQRREET